MTAPEVTVPQPPNVVQADVANHHPSESPDHRLPAGVYFYGVVAVAKSGEKSSLVPTTNTDCVTSTGYDFVILHIHNLDPSVIHHEVHRGTSRENLGYLGRADMPGPGLSRFVDDGEFVPVNTSNVTTIESVEQIPVTIVTENRVILCPDCYKGTDRRGLQCPRCRGAGTLVETVYLRPRMR